MAALALAGLGVIVVFLLFVGRLRMFCLDQALSGMQAGRIAVSDMSCREFRLAIDRSMTYPEKGLVVLEDDFSCLVSPAELGC